MESNRQEISLQTNSDEIDLFEVFEKIWNGKVLIAGIILISAVVAFVGLKLTPVYYQIETTIDKVSIEDLRPLYPTVLDGKEYKVLDGKSAFMEYQISIPDENKIYDDALLKINSLSLLKSFWEKKIGKSLDLRRNAVITDDVIAFKNFQKSFLLAAPNLKTPTVTARKISFEFQDPEEGVALLGQYLDFVNQQLWLEYFAKVEASYNSNLKVLDISYNTKKMVESRKLNDDLIVWRENLKIAESLGIKETPFKELENIQSSLMNSRLYLLGTKPLAKQIEIFVARQSGSLSPYSLELRKMETWREQMTSDLQRIKDLNDKTHLFSVVNQPESSLDPVKPQKALIFIAVVFLSGVFGVFFVLIRSAIRNHKTIPH